MWVFANRVPRIAVVAWALVGASAARLQAQFGPEPALNPRTYTSPSGKFVVSIDPSERHGAGEGRYRLSAGGQERWSKKFPFTFQDAGVTDEGVTVGYAYSEGLEGPREGDLIVAMIDAQGEVLLEHSTTRQPSRFLHVSADPKVNGLIVDATNDRIVVRVDDADVNRSQESWWVYQISTASAMKKFEPSQQLRSSRSARFVLAATQLPQTPLTLVHWWRFDSATFNSEVGAIYALIDLDGNAVWTLDLPNDYAVRGNEAAEDELRNLMRERGGILGMGADGTFEIFAAKDAQRVTMRASRADDGKLTVKEVRRAPHEFKPTLAVPAAIPAAEWNYLGPVTLKRPVEPVASPIRDVHQLVFDGNGRIAFLRRDRSGSKSDLVLIDAEGKVLHEVPLKVELPEDFEWTSHCWVGGSKYVVAASHGEEGHPARAWWVNVTTSEMTAIEGFDCPAVERLAGLSNGEFVALGKVHREYTIEDLVCGFDAQGRRAWSHSAAYGHGDETGFEGADDIAVTTDGEIVVLETVPETLRFFDRQGHFLRQIKLEDVWGRVPNYTSNLWAGPDGGVIVEDFHGKSPYVRMDANGAIKAELAPKFDDGRGVECWDGIQAAPDGQLWATDGYCIVRLNSGGVVDRVFGKAPSAAELGEIAGAAIAKDGRMYVGERRTGAVHVFDAQGAFLHVCEPQPREVFSSDISVADTGEVYVGIGDKFAFGSDGPRPYARFSSTGERLENIQWPGRESSVVSGTGNVLSRLYQRVELYEASGTMICDIQRRSDGNWLEYIGSTDSGPNGELAIASDGSISIYDAAGGPLSTLILPAQLNRLPQIAFDGRRLIVCAENLVVLFNEQGQPVQQMTPKNVGTKEPFWFPYLVANGRELLLFETQTGTFHRYGLP